MTKPDRIIHRCPECYYENEPPTKRYVVVSDIAGLPATASEAHGRWPNTRVYELGPEVKDPDYEPLLKWHRFYAGYLHRPECARYGSTSFPASSCTCGLSDALKAAGL